MPDYHALYLQLFRAQADAIAQLGVISENLIRTHREAEEAVINSPDPVVRLMQPEPEDGK